MKINLLRVLLLTGLAGPICIGSVKATSQQGGYITYQHIGQDSFIVKLVQYSECDAIAFFPSSRTVSVSSSCASSFNVILNKTQTITIISNTCDSVGYSCGSGSGPLGLAMHTYRDTVVLPTPCADWTFDYSSCCRPATENFRDGNGTSSTSIFSITASVNTVLAPANSSPELLNPGNAYLIPNQWSRYNANAVDADGHNLLYGFYQPQPQSGVTYFQHDSLEIDSLNGDVSIKLSGTATGQIFVFQKIYELNQSGDTIGFIRHEFRFTEAAFLPGSNVPPDTPGDLSNVTNGQTLSAQDMWTCPGTTICFDVQLSDPNSNQAVFVNDSLLQASLPGASITKTGSNPMTMNVCWTAPPGFHGKRQFSVLVADSACPVIGEAQRGYSIWVPGAVVAHPDSFSICKGESVQLHAYSDTAIQWQSISGNSTAAANFSCTNCSDPVIAPDQTSVFRVYSTQSTGCNGSDTVVVRVDSVAPITINSIRDTACLHDTLVYSVNPTTASVMWQSGFNGNTLKLPAMTQGSKTIYATAANGNCMVSDTVSGFVSPGIPADFGALPYILAICKGDISVIITHTGNGPYADKWHPSGLSGDETVSFQPTQTDTAIVEITELIAGCKDTAIYPVQVFGISAAYFGLNDTVFCKGDSIETEVVVNGGSSPYFYSINQQPQSHNRVRFKAETDTLLYATIVDSMGCRISTDTLSINVTEGVRLSSSADTVFTVDSVRLCITPKDGLPPFHYNWNIASGNDTCLVVNSVKGNPLEVVVSVQGTCGFDGDTIFVVHPDDVGLPVVRQTFKGKIYPNPAGNYFTIEVKQPGRVQLYTTEGRSVMKANLNRGANQIDAGNLSAGTYLVELVSGESVSYQLIEIR